MKKGISLITMLVAIVVMIVVSTITIYNVVNMDALKFVSETKFKTDLKNFDYEVRDNMSHQNVSQDFLSDFVTYEPNEIRKYAPGLPDSIYSDIAYVGEGRLVLSNYKITEQQRKWAIETDIKIDETITLTDKVNITLSTEDWVKDGVTAYFSYDSIIPKGYEIQYKTQYSGWVTGTAVFVETNQTVMTRLYNSKRNHATAENSRVITNIDQTPPTVATSVAYEEKEFYSVKIKAQGSTDTQSGLAGYKYSLDDENWSEIIAPNTSIEYTNLKSSREYDIYVISVDNVGNENKTTMRFSTKVITAPTITTSPTDWTKDNVDVTVEHNDIMSGYKLQYKIIYGSQTELEVDYTTVDTSTVSDEAIDNGEVLARLYNETLDDSSLVARKIIDNIDRMPPTNPTNVAITRSINSFTAQATGSVDEGCGLAGYKYSLDQVTWVGPNTTSNLFETFKSETDVTLYVTAIDNLGNETAPMEVVAGTLTITNNVQIDTTPTTWTNTDVEATLSYPTSYPNYKLQYSYTGDDDDWHDYTQKLPIDENKTVYGRLYNATLDDAIAENSKDITNIDRNPPTAPTDIEIIRDENSLQVKASGSTDDLSGIAGYIYSIDNGVTWTSVVSKNSYHTFSSLTIGTTYDVMAKAVDRALNISLDGKVSPTSTKYRYTVSYNANGGVGAPTNQTKFEGTALTLSTTVPTNTTGEFMGWTTTDTSTTVEYNPGDPYNVDADVELFAVWKDTKIYVGDYVDYNPASLSARYSTTSYYLGAYGGTASCWLGTECVDGYWVPDTHTWGPDTGGGTEFIIKKWRILNINDDTVDLIASETSGVNYNTEPVALGIQCAYNNGVQILNSICNLYSNSRINATARSLNIEDIQDKMKKDANDKKLYEKYVSPSGTNWGTSASGNVNGMFGRITLAGGNGYTQVWGRQENLSKAPDEMFSAGSNAKGGVELKDNSGYAGFTIYGWSATASELQNEFVAVETRDNSNDTSIYYNLIFGPSVGSSYGYWVGSRADTEENDGTDSHNLPCKKLGYGLFRISGGAMNTMYTFYTNGTQIITAGITYMPVVTIPKSAFNFKVGNGTKASPWGVKNSL